MKRPILPLVSLLSWALVVAVTVTTVQAQDLAPRSERKGKGGKGKRGGGDRPRPGGNRTIMQPPEVVALQPLSAMLGRPTDHSITANLLANEPREVFIEYGTAVGRYDQHTQTLNLAPGSPREQALS